MAERRRGGWVRSGLLGLLTALLVGLVPFVAGVDLAHTLAIALGAAAITIAVQALPPVPRIGWPADPEHDEGTGWHQVRLLSQALGQLDEEPDRARTALLPRLRALASGRLRAAGVDPASPLARELLGGELHDALGGTGRLASARRRAASPVTDLVRALLDRLDELDRMDRMNQRDRPPDPDDAPHHDPTAPSTAPAKDGVRRDLTHP